jgi:dihydrodipicolinate synthase/N-acetylneuraminate lyase
LERRPVRLPQGIVGVVQTPFLSDGAIDEASLNRLVEASIVGGVSGLVAPAVASEVESLSRSERERIVRVIRDASGGRVPLIVGASSNDIDESASYGRFAASLGAIAFLVAVPADFYGEPGRIVSDFATIAARVDLPMIVQDLQWNGPGLELECIREMVERIPNFAGLKIETVPAGPKYTLVREALGQTIYLAGGWAVPQLIEALDRGVDALMPECSMAPVYTCIDALHRAGRRDAAVRLFRELLPVLSYTNQEIRTSIAFFKELLVRKKIFRTAAMRGAPFAWDDHNRRIAEELIEHYLMIERRLGSHKELEGRAAAAGAVLPNERRRAD